MNEHKATNARPVPRFLAGNHDFAFLYKCFAVLCYLFLTVHFACIMVLGLHTASPIHPWIFCYYFGCALAGYGVQYLTGLIFRIVRPKAENNYEDIKRRYKPVQAIPCHIFAAVWFGIAQDIGFEILREHAIIFSHNSIYPLIFAIGSFILIEFGAYLWFFPYNVLVSMRSIAIVSIMMLVQTVVLVYVRGGFGLGFYSISLVVTEFLAILIYMILLNQCFLTRQYDNRVSYVNDAAKLYSAGVVVGASSVIVLMAGMIRLILIGLLKLLEQILGRMFIEGETGTTPYSPGFGYGGMQKLFDGEDAKSNGLLAVLLMGLLFITLFIIIASPAIRDWLRRLWKQLLADLAEFFKMKKKFRKSEQIEERFVDTVENLARRTKTRGSLPSAVTFERRLSRIENPVDRYAYAYSVYAAYMEQTHSSVLVSDTPRERSGKVRTDDRYPDAASYSALFEQLRYADDMSGQADLQQRSRDICAFLRQVL